MSANDDEGATRQTVLPQSPSEDDKPTGHVADSGVVAELRAVLTSGERKMLPLYTLADSLTLGRGSACEWQLDDSSLSRKHAQLKWNGRELTVEDLGSANGTRVEGRPARTATPVRPGEAIQLGTVTVTLMVHGGPNPDEQSTRLVQTPEARAEAFPQLPALATVVKPTRPSGARAVAAAMPGVQQVFRPSKDSARADEPTRPWDPRAALVHPPAKAFDGELMDRVKQAWRENRRPFVLAGAALWIGMLLTVWYIHDSAISEEETLREVPHVRAPRVSTLPPTPPAPDPLALPPEAADAGPPLSDDDKDEQLSQAVAAFDQGRMAEALALFKRLGPGDESARFMVELIQQRLGTGGAP